MVTISDLCQDAQKIGERFGLEWEVIGPPKPTFYYKYQVRFRNNLLSKPLTYVYEIPQHQWKRFQDNKSKYEEFILYLISKIIEYLLKKG